MGDQERSRRGPDQARLVEAARLSGVARVVPSFAHRMATPLASIALRAESLEHASQEPGGPDPERLGRYLRAIGEETQKCKELLATLQEFARRPAGRTDVVDVNALCRGAVRLVQHEGMQRQVELVLALDEALPVVRGCRAELSQAILAIVLNAVAATRAGGHVHVQTRPADAGGVEVVVRDEGEGMASHVRERLGEAFLSTRSPGQGLGLGLFAARILAGEHGGSIDVGDIDDAPGCRVRLRLPLEGATGPEAAKQAGR